MHLQIKKLFENNSLKTLNKNTIVDIDKYNRQLFASEAGLGICEFVEQWIKRPDAIVVGYYHENNLQGYGVATICN